MPCPTAYARLIHGAMAAASGDSKQASARFAEAVECFESLEMRLCPRQHAAAWGKLWEAHRARNRSIERIGGCLSRRSRIPSGWPR